jgi:hypothetical protein
MEPQSIARLQALGRIGIGAALVAAPERVLAGWIGSDASRSGPQVIGAALGIRDLAIGAGVAGALWRGDGARAWLRAGTASDLVDFAATVRAREDLPMLGVVGVGIIAAGSAALGVWLQAVLD